jgi:hypothetical protein
MALRLVIEEPTVARLMAADRMAIVHRLIAGAARCLPTTEEVRHRMVAVVDTTRAARRRTTAAEAEVVPTTVEAAVADRMVAEVEATPAVIANPAADNENAAPQGRRSF